MGRTLAGLFPDWVTYVEVEDAGHVDVSKNHPALIYDALAGKYE